MNLIGIYLLHIITPLSCSKNFTQIQDGCPSQSFCRLKFVSQHTLIVSKIAVPKNKHLSSQTSTNFYRVKTKLQTYSKAFTLISLSNVAIRKKSYLFILILFLHAWSLAPNTHITVHFGGPQFNPWLRREPMPSLQCPRSIKLQRPSWKQVHL